MLLGSVLLRNARHPAARVLSKALVLLSGILAAPSFAEGFRDELRNLEKLLRQLMKDHPDYKQHLHAILSFLKSLHFRAASAA